MRAALITSVALLVAMGFAPITSASEHPLVEECPGTEAGVIVNATDSVYHEACLTTVETCEDSHVGVVINTTDVQQAVCVPQPVEVCDSNDGVIITTPDGQSTGVCGPPNYGLCGDEVGVTVAGYGICIDPSFCIGNICLF